MLKGKKSKEYLNIYRLLERFYSTVQNDYNNITIEEWYIGNNYDRTIRKIYFREHYCKYITIEELNLMSIDYIKYRLEVGNYYDYDSWYDECILKLGRGLKINKIKWILRKKSNITD